MDICFFCGVSLCQNNHKATMLYFSQKLFEPDLFRFEKWLGEKNKGYVQTVVENAIKAGKPVEPELKNLLKLRWEQGYVKSEDKKTRASW